jgi:hypothetical protein
MKLALELTLSCTNEEQARSLKAVLAPDNKNFPKDQSFVEEVDGSQLRFLITSERASGCISSALGILTDAKLFQDVWEMTKS